ncbi:MAG TPA: CvpA family protein [Puia sp.]|jgi:membrane protein required for colicin V production|nr:CvpA family protein [Puia sp.]
MGIDILFLVFVIIAVFRGLRRGLIVAVFSFAACIIGLAAAVKLSAIVAVHLKDAIHVSEKWLPILAFILVFVLVVFVVRRAANLLEKLIDFVWLEWLNKLGGVILYTALYLAVFSVLLFYGSSSHILPRSMIESSKVYHFIEPWGPAVINQLARIIPLFRDMFVQLEAFFGNLLNG